MTIDSRDLAIAYAVLFSAALTLTMLALVAYLGWLLGLLAAAALYAGAHAAKAQLAEGCIAASRATFSLASKLKARFA